MQIDICCNHKQAMIYGTVRIFYFFAETSLIKDERNIPMGYGTYWRQSSN